jgi:hypothetical protein
MRRKGVPRGRSLRRLRCPRAALPRRRPRNGRASPRAHARSATTERLRRLSVVIRPSAWAARLRREPGVLSSIAARRSARSGHNRGPLRNIRFSRASLKSGRPDLNRGPHRPERCALPGCATPRMRPVFHRVGEGIRPPCGAPPIAGGALRPLRLQLPRFFGNSCCGHPRDRAYFVYVTSAAKEVVDRAQSPDAHRASTRVGAGAT